MKGQREGGVQVYLVACVHTVYLALTDGALAGGGGGNPVHYLDLQL